MASSKVKFTLLASEWGSKHGGLSTFNRVFAIKLAKHSKAHVSVFVPRCDHEEINDACGHNITLVKAERRAGFHDEKDWLCFPPDDLQIDIVIGHGVVLGRQAQIIRQNRRCKWMQFVHTDPEELGMFKNYSNPIEKGEQKHKDEVELCAMADFVVAVGPKLGEAYRSYLRSHKKDQKVFVLTPSLFDEFSDVEQATEDGDRCRVLAFGRGDAEDFSLKGFDIAAKAIGKLQDANLIFVGASSKQQDEVADNLKKCGLSPDRLRVRTFQETRESLKNLFCEVDLAIMPSRTEGFGLTALEALSAGLPVLASENSGFGKALCKVPFGSSCVIESEDPKEWAEAIKKVWKKDRETRLVESNTLRTSYAEKYSWKKQCNDLVEIAGSVIAGRLGERESDRMTATKRTAGQKVADVSAEFAEPDPKRSKLTAAPTGEFAVFPPVPPEPRRVLRSSSSRKPVKAGNPSDDELEKLSTRLGDNWEKLGRRLGFNQSMLTAFHKENERLFDKAHRMLMSWKQKEGSSATYQVLYDALCHTLVACRSLAEELCCQN